MLRYCFVGQLLEVLKVYTGQSMNWFDSQGCVLVQTFINWNRFNTALPYAVRLETNNKKKQYYVSSQFDFAKTWLFFSYEGVVLQLFESAAHYLVRNYQGLSGEKLYLHYRDNVECFSVKFVEFNVFLRCCKSFTRVM